MISLRNSNHIKFLNEYIEFILNLKTEIKYKQEALLTIFKKCGNKKLLFPMLDKCLELSETIPLKQAWDKAFSNLHHTVGASAEEEKIIKNFVLNLGLTDTESQLNYCDYNISIIKPFLIQALENKKKNEQLPIILGICLSLIISTVII